MKTRTIVLAVLLIVGVTACEKNEPQLPSNEFNPDLRQAITRLDLDIQNTNALKSADIYEWATALNKALLKHDLQLEKMETYGADEQGILVTFYNERGNKQLSSDYVPNHPESLMPFSVPYMIDNTQQGTSSGMTPDETKNAIMSAMSTWDNAKCSEGLEIPILGSTDFNIGVVENSYDPTAIAAYLGGVITHAGILPSEFFEMIGGPGGGDNILGVTFTFIWGNNEGEEFIPDDIDNNGKTDVAFKEIYINDGFDWRDDPNAGIFDNHFDFETVVLHEAGHGLSQAHYGRAFIARDLKKIHFAPLALMNNAYTGSLREITKTDLAGHCSIWGDWPQN